MAKKQRCENCGGKIHKDYCLGCGKILGKGIIESVATVMCQRYKQPFYSRPNGNSQNADIWFFSVGKDLEIAINIEEVSNFWLTNMISPKNICHEFIKQYENG